MLLVINPRAGGGAALRRWERVEDRLSENRVPEVAVLDDLRALPERVRAGIDAGHRTFLAGGGDGTVNALASALLAVGAGDRMLGAIGLGSSNDFHKPGGLRVAGVPCRMDRDHPTAADVGILRVTDADGETRERNWLINASCGLTADANLRFNRAGGLLRGVKRVSPGLAIALTAAGTVLADRGHELTVEVDGEVLPGTRFRNLAMVRNPNFAGCLRYDARPAPLPGGFRLHGVGDVSLPSLLRILAGLCRGRFAGRPGTFTRDAVRLRVTGDRPFAVEFDGEVLAASILEVGILPRPLEVCA